mmetsp:Transcript_68093/g.188592  ORF Transcript_68093/g.188592 Transcript_68093/m.188592 type:complete len:581 (-) Transcript_68093:1034-2776(-)
MAILAFDGQAPPNTLIEHVHVTQFEKKNHLIEFIITVEPYAHRAGHYTVGKRYEEFEQLKSHCSSIKSFKSKFPGLKSFGSASTKDLHARCHGLDLWLRECLDVSASFPIIQRALFKFLDVHTNVDLGLGAAPAGGAVQRASAAAQVRRRSQQHKTLDFSALALGAAGGDVEADITSPPAGAAHSFTLPPSAPSAPPPPPPGPSATRQQIDAMYRQYNPAKLIEVDGLVGRFGEEQLLAMIKDKYLAPPAPAKPQVSMRAAGAAVMAAGAVQQVGGPGAGAPTMMAAGAVQQVGGPGAGAPTMMAAGAVQQVGGPGAGAPPMMAAGAVQQVSGRRPSKGQAALASGLAAFQGAYAEEPPQELPASAVAPRTMAASAAPMPAPAPAPSHASSTQEVEITVPSTARGGDTLMLKLSTGQDVKIKLPHQARPGQKIKIQVPTSAPAPAPAPAPMTPEMKLAAEMGVSVEQAAQMIRENAEAKKAQRRASITLQASAPQPVRPGMGGRSESMMLAQEIGVDRVTARHMIDENRQASNQVRCGSAVRVRGVRARVMHARCCSRKSAQLARGARDLDYRPEYPTSS